MRLPLDNQARGMIEYVSQTASLGENHARTNERKFDGGGYKPARIRIETRGFCIPATRPPFSLRKFQSLLCAALLAVIFLATSCSGAESGDDAPPLEIPGSGDNAGGDGSSSDKGGDESPEPTNPSDPSNSTEPTDSYYKNVSEILKEILGSEYETISGDISQSITLTAQTIKAASDIFPVLESVINNANKMDSAKEQVVKSNNDTKNALVAQAENKITIKGKTAEYEGYIENEETNTHSPTTVYDGYGYEISANGNMNIILSGKFNYFYDHIDSLKGNVDISKVEIYSDKLKGWDDDLKLLSSSLKEEIYEKLSLDNKTVDALPKLSFGLYNDDYYYGLKRFMDIYSKYNKSEKLNITASFGIMDGRYLVNGVNPDNYTLFESDGNTVKSDNTVKSMDINELIEFTNKYDVYAVRNMIITGKPNSKQTVDWELTNVIFKEDMSNLTNTSTYSLTGVVYFNDLPYNNNLIVGQFINGVVKLNKLSKNINLQASIDFGIVDLRGIDKNTMNSYDMQEIFIGGLSSVYFAEDIKELSRIKTGEKNRDFYKKLIDIYSKDVHNEYYGTGDREDGYITSGYNNIPTSKKARTLKEFEYYGNNNKFEKSAYDSYNGNFDGLTEDGLFRLTGDHNYMKQIARGARRSSVFFV